MEGELIYVVTDAEFDGPVPGRNSMLAFASVAVTPTGEKRGEFEGVLERLEGATTAHETTTFWQKYPDAYAAWIDFYLQRFTGERLLEGPWLQDRLFNGAPFCLHSFAAGTLGWPQRKCSVGHYPPEWLGDVKHTHHAIDDARGYANLLVYLMELKPTAESPR